MTSIDNPAWFPLFEFQDWHYQSTVLLEPGEKNSLQRGQPIAARVWGSGTFQCGQAFRSDEAGLALDGPAAGGGYSLTGKLVFGPGATLDVTITGRLGHGNAPATFEGTGIATDGAMQGAVSKLAGWVFPELPIQNNAARVLSVQGAVWAVRGTDARPDIEPGGMSIDDVGSFVLSRA